MFKNAKAVSARSRGLAPALTVLALAVLVLLLLAPARPVSAMSLDTYNIMLKASPQFAQAAEFTEKVWEKLRQNVNADQYAEYEQAQQHWINETIDANVVHLLQSYFNDPNSISASAMNEKSLFSLPEACARALMERAKIIHILAAQAADEHLVISLPGKLLLVENEEEKYYGFCPNEWDSSFYLGTDAELATLPGSTYKRIVKLASVNPEKNYILSGRLSGFEAYDLNTGLMVEDLPEGMGWRELDQWDYLDD